ncbi:flagellar hook-basal body complex protein [Sulfurimonas sp.]|jgi:flagellar hook protein FlgE|uniref:flagellar hook protein FlgE n=1 Tax=Sulfurimonas sp. TaxID=2022749 RepID=UPI002A36E27E|nr:flagellar hook-basal body complex protein [Sulfurimonas sp.]MDY0122645.1 flagellar hook-basal body complex protein [Sulfurimonas sp.]
MMSQAFYTGINGIKAHQYGIDVISDNLSNISTNGFRGYTTEFSSLFEEALVTASSFSNAGSGVGIGTKLNAVAMNESQGVFKLSDRSTDLAIMGDGWFGIQAEGKPLYTRDGAFTFDKNRDLVTNDGYYVLGTMGNNINDGVLTQQLAEVELGAVNTQQKLQFPEDLIFPVQPTTEASFYGNLTALDETRVISAGIIDAQNNRNNLRLEFTKSVPQVSPGSQWDITATVENLEGTEVYTTNSGRVTFDAAGALLTNTLTSINNNGTNVAINLGSGYDGVIAMGDKFSSSSSANGLEAGDLLGYDINKNAEVVATFSNGMQSAVGMIAVYHFQNDRGLERINGARFAESQNSGRPIFFQDENGKSIIGTDITNFKLEGSNVRMEVGLTEIIVMQRSYDANSKSITTADEMLQKALSMDA